MRSPQNFSNPDEFKPDRWSEASGTNLSEPFIGFSKGTRMCVGKDFALRVLFLATIEIISKFDLHCDYEQEKRDESVCQVTLLPTSGKLELEFQAINV
jgi:cytochrome P450